MSNYSQKQPTLRKSSSSYVDLNCFNWASQPADSLLSIVQEQWEVKSLQISSHGSTGVLFVETSIGSFVLKMNNEAPINQFFNILASVMDVNVPDIMVIACYDDFFQKLVFKIEKFCQKDQGLAARLRKRMDFPFYQLIQYIPSISLIQVGKNRFEKYQLSESRLQSIGLCLGYDIMTNNSDRFKLSKIWASTSQGNVLNVLIKIANHFSYDITNIKDRQNTAIQLGDYVYIDHCGFFLDIEKNKLAADNFNKYVQKVMILHDQTIQFIRKQLPCPEHFQGLIKQIQLYTKHTISQQQITHIIEGIIYSTSLFINLYEQKTFEQILGRLKRGENNQKSQKSQTKYWDDYWNLDLERIKLKHLQIYHTKVSAIYLTYTEIIQGICERVARNLTHDRKSQKTVSSLRGSQRPQSKRSNASQNSKLSDDFLKKYNQPEKILQNEIQKENQSMGKMNQSLQNQKQPQKVRVIPEGIGRRKLKQKLQAFQKKNYSQHE